MDSNFSSSGLGWRRTLYRAELSDTLRSFVAFCVWQAAWRLSSTRSREMYSCMYTREGEWESGIMIHPREAPARPPLSGCVESEFVNKFDRGDLLLHRVRRRSQFAFLKRKNSNLNHPIRSLPVDPTESYTEVSCGFVDFFLRWCSFQYVRSVTYTI